jgi:chromo domain-containing protein 1
MIFHPPRGNKLPPGQRTKCTNKLYEAARLARARNGKDMTMMYKLPSTTNWYDEQVAEGRDFKHITFETNYERFLDFFYPKGNSNVNSKAGPRVSD